MEECGEDMVGQEDMGESQAARQQAVVADMPVMGVWTRP